MKEWNKPQLLNRKEAAEFLGLKAITLASWKTTRRYDLPVIKVGRLVRYRITDLVAFLERRTERSQEGRAPK